MDDGKTKREARRRKILENSEKRLQKITRCKLEEPNDEDINIEKIYKPARSASVENTGHYEGDVTNSVDEKVTVPRENSDNEHLQNLLDYAPEPTAVCEDSSSDEKPYMKIWENLGFKLVILAVIVRIVHIFKLGYLFGETIVIPFALFMMTQLNSCQFDQKGAGITGPLLFFIGMSPNRIKNLLICYNVVTSILVYFGIYFFTFVCAHLTFAKVFGL